jgi:hypothetical protein
VLVALVQHLIKLLAMGLILSFQLLLQQAVAAEVVRFQEQVRLGDQAVGVVALLVRVGREPQVKVLLEARILVVAVVAVQGRLVEQTDLEKAAMVFFQTLLGQTLNERGVVVLVEEAQLGPQEAQVAVVLVLEILLELLVREINLKEEEAAVAVLV